MFSLEKFVCGLIFLNLYFKKSIVLSIKVTSLETPVTSDVRHDIPLKCAYRLDSDKLQSLKIYCDGMEIFRYLPTNMDKIQKFNNTTGCQIKLAKCSNNKCTVSIKANYGNHSVICQVSAEWPSFYIDELTTHVNVIGEPQYDPVIVGIPDHIQIGDEIILNCTSDLSFPPCDILWTIDDKMVSNEQTFKYIVSDPDEIGMRKSTKSLYYRVNKMDTRIGCSCLIAGRNLKSSSVLLKNIRNEPLISKFMSTGIETITGNAASRSTKFIITYYFYLNLFICIHFFLLIDLYR